MANVQTDEVEAEYVEPVNLTTIRDAILELIPDDPNIARDVRMHDGLADIAIRWRTLRWSTCMAVQTMTPDDIAVLVAGMFLKWVVSTLNNTNDTPRHAHILREMNDWLVNNREGIWSAAERYKDKNNEVKWRVKDVVPVSNKTEIAA